MNQNSQKERRVTAYLHPTILAKFKDYVRSRRISESEALNDAVRIMLNHQDKPSRPIKAERSSSY